MKSKIDKKAFIKICNGSISMLNASRKLKLPFSTFKRYAIKFNCYTTNQGAKGSSKPLKDFNEIINNDVQIRTHHVKNKLFQLGIKKYRCEECNIKKWKNKPITLELHHIDGNNKNNNLNNLQILCPNCHSQTPNYRRWNKKKKK